MVLLARQARDLRGGMPKAALFLNQAKKGTVLLREAQAALTQGDIPLLDAVIYDRQVITDAPSQGQVVWQMGGSASKSAVTEFEQLFAEAWEKLSGKD